MIFSYYFLAVSYNQPKFFSNASWNPNAITFADNNTIGQSPFDIFINTNNTIYVPNQQNGQIVIWIEENSTLTINNSITSSNLSNPSSLFVTMSGAIYVDTLNSFGGVSEWTSNLTSGILTMRTCQKCYDLFVDISNMLYCSLGGHHQVIAKSLNYSTNEFLIVAGTGSADTALNALHNPRGIFVDINFDLYVADCGNNRIQLFYSGKLTGITVAGNRSSNITITLNCPTGIILDADKYLFIVDNGNNRIVRSGLNGFQCLVGCSGSSGSAPNQLKNPWAISFDSDGNIFVTDQGNSRIQKFIFYTTSPSKFKKR
jgi:sugar lactone lactonase YvrE